jgi:hypothetical protein
MLEIDYSELPRVWSKRLVRTWMDAEIIRKKIAKFLERASSSLHEHPRRPLRTYLLRSPCRLTPRERSLLFACLTRHELGNPRGNLTGSGLKSEMARIDE